VNCVASSLREAHVLAPARTPSKNAPRRPYTFDIMLKPLAQETPSAKQIIEIPVDLLSKGAYVSRLDRPWIDSPFLFQGFQIESDAELQQLKDLCKRVHVEVTAEEAQNLRERMQLRTAAAKPAEQSLTSLDELSQNINARLHLVPAKDPVPLKTELLPARGAYGQARDTVAKIFDRLKRGGGLDVQLMESAVESMVDSIFRNREAMGWLARMKVKDDYLYSHSLAASVWALAFGRHLGLDKIALCSLSAWGPCCWTSAKLSCPPASCRSPASRMIPNGRNCCSTCRWGWRFWKRIRARTPV
jgi:hypothetical protein